MDVVLKPDLAAFVKARVQSGQYANADEVINGALEVLRDVEHFSPDELARVRREIAIGIDQADRGEFVEFDAASIKAAGRELRKSQNR